MSRNDVFGRFLWITSFVATRFYANLDRFLRCSSSKSSNKDTNSCFFSCDSEVWFWIRTNEFVISESFCSTAMNWRWWLKLSASYSPAECLCVFCVVNTRNLNSFVWFLCFKLYDSLETENSFESCGAIQIYYYPNGLTHQL